ncbi:MAG: hypothetical protein U0T85_03320 [Cloacibacterium normanense]
MLQKKSCGRLEWSVLDWNTPSIEFAKSLGAKPMDEWTVFRLDKTGIEKFSQINPNSSINTSLNQQIITSLLCISKSFNTFAPRNN